jgi:hypothetical protein
MPLSEADRIRLLEELAQDPDLKATQRLRALEELGRERRREAGRVETLPPEEQPDPFEDMDELEAARRRRARH